MSFPTMEEIRVSAEPLAARARLRRARRHSPPYAKGPIPLPLVKVCVDANKDALPLLLAIRFASRARDEAAIVGNTLAEMVGLDDRRRKIALGALERAGLVYVERLPGRAPRARELPWRQGSEAACVEEEK